MSINRYGLKNWLQDKNLLIDDNYQVEIDHKYTIIK